MAILGVAISLSLGASALATQWTPHQPVADASASDAPQRIGAEIQGPRISWRDVAGRRIAREALRYRGVPYVWGGGSPSGFDCSGLTSYVYARFGTAMAHSSYTQRDAYPQVARSRLRPGDLVFFAGAGHVGIYIGDGRFVHARRGGFSVEVSSLGEGWYRTQYAGAVRPPIAHPRRTMSSPAST